MGSLKRRRWRERIVALEADPPARLKPAVPGESGRVVQKPPDAVRWILERVADALGVDKDALGIKKRRAGTDD